MEESVKKLPEIILQSYYYNFLWHFLAESQTTQVQGLFTVLNGIIIHSYAVHAFK